MAINRIDMTPIVTHLQTLKESISKVNDEEIKSVIDMLHKNSNKLTNKMKKGEELDPTHIKTVKQLMYEIQHTATFAQAVGHQQKHLLDIFRRIETLIQPFESKVNPVDKSEPLR